MERGIKAIQKRRESISLQDTIVNVQIISFEHAILMN